MHIATCNLQLKDDLKQKEGVKFKENEINMLNIVNSQLDTGAFIETQVKLIEKWNRITPCIIEGRRLVIDRRSWIAKNGKIICNCSPFLSIKLKTIIF